MWPALDLVLHYGDLADPSLLLTTLNRVRPSEIYNLGAQSHVKVSFDMPVFTVDTVGMGTLRLLEVVRAADWPIRFYQAGSSDMYGDVAERPQRETTPFRPRSPYAAAKVLAHWLTAQYRDGYGIFATNGILFNHESPRRGETFVTRKILGWRSRTTFPALVRLMLAADLATAGVGDVLPRVGASA